MVSNIVEEPVSGHQLLDRCLAELGEMELSDETSTSLQELATTGGPVDREKAAQMLRMIAASRDFQRC